MTAAAVPTGMKIGVRITPWSVASSPARASVRVSVCRSVNCIMSVNTPAPAIAAVRPRDADAATNRPHTSGSVYDPAVRYAGVPDGSGGRTVSLRRTKVRIFGGFRMPPQEIEKRRAGIETDRPFRVPPAASESAPPDCTADFICNPLHLPLLIRNLCLRSDTPARQCSNKFDIAHTYSYL